MHPLAKESRLTQNSIDFGSLMDIVFVTWTVERSDEWILT